jgi:CRISPR-associated protein Cas1
MAVIYITEQGSIVQRRDGRFVVRKEKTTLQDVPEVHVDQLVLFGNVHLTTPVIAYCLNQGIDVAFLSSTGRYRGRLHGEWPKSAALRQRQYARSLDAAFCLSQARTLVRGKVANLLAFARRQPASPDGPEPVTNLTRVLGRIERAPSLEALLGLEGAASAAYFAAFARWVPAPWRFTKRIAHPPPDPVNALLSLGYTLVYNRTSAAINVVGLDPYQGFFHALRHGHAALASDLMEEFRPIIVDAMVLTLLKKRMLRPDDFADAGPGVQLKPAALARYLQAFEARLHTNVPYEPDGARFSFGQIIERQVRQFARVILGEEKSYRPFVVK